MAITRHRPEIPIIVADASNLQSVDVIFRLEKYPARSLEAGEVPYWMKDRGAKGPARFMDVVFKVVMISDQLSNKLDDAQASKSVFDGIYVDAILTSKLGGKAAIKDATVAQWFAQSLTLIGGIFVLNENLTLPDKKQTVDKDLQRFQNIDLED